MKNVKLENGKLYRLKYNNGTSNNVRLTYISSNGVGNVRFKGENNGFVDISETTMSKHDFRSIATLLEAEELILTSIVSEVTQKLEKAKATKKENITKLQEDFNYHIGWRFAEMVLTDLEIKEFSLMLNYVTGENKTLEELNGWVQHHIQQIERLLLDGKIKTSSSKASNLQSEFEFEAKAELRKYYKTIVTRIEKVTK